MKSFFPRLCVVCGRGGGYLCCSCLVRAGWQYQQVCHVCRGEVFGGVVHKECADYSWLDGVWACARYGPPLDKVLWLAKYGFYADIASWLGELMAAKALEWDLPSQAVLTTVPLTMFRRWWRGFNQAEVMARAGSARLGIPSRRLLKRTRYRGVQMRRGREQRLVAARSSVEVVGVVPHVVVVIDDVYTTGATLEACARCLKAAGAKRVYAAVLMLH